MFTQFRQDFNVILPIYRLDARYPLCHHNTLDIKENKQNGLELQMTHACFFVLEMMLTSTALIFAWFLDHM